MATSGVPGGRPRGFRGPVVVGRAVQGEDVGARRPALACQVVVQAGQLGLAVNHLVGDRGADAATPDQ
jgi:hypothetical protein